MFTGLVECLGTVRSLTAAGAGRELVVTATFAGELDSRRERGDQRLLSDRG